MIKDAISYANYAFDTSISKGPKAKTLKNQISLQLVCNFVGVFPATILENSISKNK